MAPGLTFQVIMKERSITALIFDMDGVLVDSEPLHLSSFQELLEGFEIPWGIEQNQQYLGRKDIEIAAEIIEKNGLDLTPSDLVEGKEELFHKLVKSNARPQPGVMELLKLAREMKMPTAVASSATIPSIKLIVETLGLRDYFDNLTSGDEVKRGKPAPDVFLLAAEKLSVPPAQCLVIEDTDAGVQAAKAAGMVCVAVPCDATRHQKHLLADARLNSLSEFNLKDWVSS